MWTVSSAHSSRAFYSIPTFRVCAPTLTRRPSSKSRPKIQVSQRAAKRSFKLRTTTEMESDIVGDTESESFNWFKHWWPVQLLYNLDTDRPNRIQLLGEYFVAWLSSSGEWVVMKDMCPHRLAPLSEGRVEDDGTLMCSYHGWRFDQSGKCIKIPQADDQKSHESACNNLRSCAMTYPCKARGGFLWIWPDHCESRFVDSSIASTGLSDEYAAHFEDRIQDGDLSFFSTVVPYGYDVLMENLLDPSHLPFSHHGSSLDVKRSDGGPIPMRAEKVADPSSVNTVSYTRKDIKVVLDMKDCSTVLYTRSSLSEKKILLVLVLFASPTEIGSCRLFLAYIFGAALSKEKSRFSWFQFLQKYCPVYFHLTRMEIFDGDNVFLHTQDYYLRNGGRRGWSPERYFTPAAADLAVVLFRRWLQSKGNDGPFANAEGERKELLPRRQLLDRYSSHVSECKICQKALNSAKRAIAVCKFVSRCALVLTGALLLHGMQHGVFAKWKTAAAAVAFVMFHLFQRFIAKKVIPLFYFTDYIHAEKN